MCISETIRTSPPPYCKRRTVDATGSRQSGWDVRSVAACRSLAPTHPSPPRLPGVWPPLPAGGPCCCRGQPLRLSASVLGSVRFWLVLPLFWALSVVRSPRGVLSFYAQGAPALTLGGALRGLRQPRLAKPWASMPAWAPWIGYMY